jgi:LuxR family maltose regulon positive regulatory protein
MSPGKRARSAAERGQALAKPPDITDPPSVPTRYDGYVRRPQLVARLREARGFPCLLVTAPAGYAKTSMLAEWAEEDDRPFAWVTLGSDDDDATRLLNRLVDAIDGVSLKGRPFVLVLDNVHALRTKGAMDALANTIASLRSDGQVALASRNEPRLPLGRMRAQREVFELTRRDLAMSRSDSAALLDALGLDLRADEVEMLFDQTEGWPAALYLAGLSLGEHGAAVHPDPAHFGGDDRFVADYLKEEFLAGPSVARVRFLLRSSVLDELTGQICDDVLERTGSARVLRELSRANMPLELLDHAGDSYRYHPLFKQMLRAELHRREPDVEAQLHQHASVWFAGRENFEEAIDHALAGGDQGRAAELIWARAAATLATGDRTAVREWLDRFGDGKAAHSLDLALSTAHLYLALGEGELALHWASVARECLDEPGSDHPDLLILAATLPQAGIEQMGRDATRAGELHPLGSPWRAISGFYAGVACQLRGDSEGARELLEEGARNGAATAPLVQILCLTQLATLHLDRDALDSAMRVMAQAHEQLDRFHLDTYPFMTLALATSSLVHARAGRIEESAADRKVAMREIERLVGFPDWFLAETRIVLARASLILDDIAGARSLLADAAIFTHRVKDGPTLQRWLSETQSSLSSATENGNHAELTPAELRTLQYLPSHLSFREIAERSFVSPNTVKTQAQAIYRKLNVSSRAEAVESASSAGLLSDEQSQEGAPWQKP